jgi:hypothetical protein
MSGYFLNTNMMVRYFTKKLWITIEFFIFLIQHVHYDL